ncbi:RNA-binding protein 43 [Trachinotus anak]|uniref:RNA-binding protein 43 n=1 Tax=Trachinotus anak TaxID=443729 RepID=UPI0039F19D6B
MDFPVEATVDLNNFRDETEVRGILGSHGFVMRSLSRDQLWVKGSFLELKAVMARLEQLLNSQTQTETPPHPSSPVQTPSSGATPKHYTNSSSVSDGNRSRLGSSPSASRVSDTSYNDPTSSEYRASFSPRADQHASFKLGSESFVIDEDVFNYAQQLRKKDIDTILENHKVVIEVNEFGGSTNITLLGRSASVAASKLQSLFDDLSKSLRTQEVPRKDMGHEGKALLGKIKKSKNIYNSVLVCEINDGLHLIGPSSKSYELKQKLLGRPVDQSGRTGRTFEKNSRGRSSSLPPSNRNNTERDSGAIANPSPGGAAGYSPSNYRDEKQEGAKPKSGAGARLGQSGASRGRSHSESREKNWAEKANGFTAETKDKGKPSKSMKALHSLQSLNPKNFKEMLKRNCKKKR